MLVDWTGHSIIDVGIAGLCAITERHNPSELTNEDLDRAAVEMERRYFHPYYSSYLSCVFMNSEFVQPPGEESQAEKKAESRRRYVKRVLYAHRHPGDPEALGRTCAFSGGLATHLIHRSQMPLITGSGVFNFFPNLQGGLAIAGAYLTALQTIPLAGRRCEGKLLIVHSDQAELTLRFAVRYWKDNQRYFNLAQTNELPAQDYALDRAVSVFDKVKKQVKYADAKAPATLLLADLQDTLSTIPRKGHQFIASATALWMSNSGQGPSLRVFTLPGSLITFLDLAIKAGYADPWRKIVATGWERPLAAAKKVRVQTKAAEAGESKEKVVLPQQPGLARNQVLQDLMAVFPEEGSIDFQAANNFVAYHLLGSRRQMRAAAGGAVSNEALRVSAKEIREREGSWLIAELFLTEVLRMDRERLDKIKSFSDVLAGEIATGNKRLLRRLLIARKPEDLHVALSKEQSRAAQEGRLLISWSDYIEVFALEDNLGLADWRLVRSLISIRVIEKLLELKAIDNEVLPEEREEETEQEVVVT